MTLEGSKHLGERRLPPWLALLLVLLLGGGAIWGILKLMKSPAPRVETVAVDQPARDGRDRANRRQAPMEPTRRTASPTTNPIRRGINALADQVRRPRGVASDQLKPEHARVFKRPEGGIRVLSESYVLFVDPKDKGGEMNLEYIDAEKWLTRQQLAVLRIAERSQQWQPSPQGAARLELTEEQLKQSKLVTDDPAIPLDDADRAKLDQLARTWDEAADAQKPAAESALLAGMREVARKNLKTARKEYVANVDKLAAMLTPQQMEQYRQTQNSPPRKNGRNG